MSTEHKSDIISLIWINKKLKDNAKRRKLSRFWEKNGQGKGQQWKP